ncbi:C40 family peptidase [Kitasatospora sp. NPDC050543]|uniref:C40 family peptidase n=1 Tax=Kitasatospora sp. NPDC050543 TaxID=3364054 RepID=UPI0037AB3AB4
MNSVNAGAPGASTTAPNESTATAARALPARPSRTGRVCRSIGLAAVIAVGAGVIGLGTSVTSAGAETAPSHAGWDGSRYWFQNNSGEWRWTTHLSVYQERTGGATTASATPAASASSGGITQGWDGSRYWFRNSKGEWRWTTHEDVYLQRTGGSSSGASTPAVTNTASGGITQGWDGSRYWFKNSKGEWRWTTHEDIYLQRTGGASGGSSTGTSSGSSGASSDAADAPSGDSGDREVAVAFALAQLGKPFVTAGNGPNGYDCSGLVQQAFRRAGIELPRVANDQYDATTPVKSSQLQRGDLLFWSDDGSARGIHHVAIYLGGNQYVEAARPGTNIRISTLSSGYYPTHMGRP